MAADPKKYRVPLTPIEIQPGQAKKVVEIFHQPTEKAFSERQRLGYFEDAPGSIDFARLNGYRTRSVTLVNHPDNCGNNRYYELASLSPREIIITPSFPINPRLAFWNHPDASEESTFRLVRSWYKERSPDDYVSHSKLATLCGDAASYILCLRGYTERRSLELKTSTHQDLSKRLLQFALQDGEDIPPVHENSNGKDSGFGELYE